MSGPPPKKPPPPKRPRNNADEYLSDDDDDELSATDLDVLNDDYGLQKHLTFHPRFHPPQDVRTRTRGRSSSGLSDQESQEDDDWDRPLRLPPRISSRNAGRSHSHQTHAYQNPQVRRRPLVDFIKNEWKHTVSSDLTSSSPTSSDFSLPFFFQIFFAPKFQRIFLVVFGLSFLVWGNWKTWAGSRYHESNAISSSLQSQAKSGVDLFGQNMRPEFLDMIHFQTLDPKFIPVEKTSDRRIIVIGDVHGCYDELDNLLSQAQYEARTDHLIFTGDLISKGPSSSAVVDLAMTARASCVRGTHEDRVLLAHRDILLNPTDDHKKKPKKESEPPPSPGVPGSSSPNIAAASEDIPTTAEAESETEDEEALAHGSISDRKLAHELKTEQIDYLATCPVILTLGLLPKLGTTHIVHAGLVPGVAPDQQDPIGVMTMRALDLKTYVPSSNPATSNPLNSKDGAKDRDQKKKNKIGRPSLTVPWHKLWNRFQARVSAAQDRSTVIYGHDADSGLQIQKYSMGLDSGCVGGGKLSGLIIDTDVTARGKAPRVVSVACKDYMGMAREEAGRARKAKEEKRENEKEKGKGKGKEER